MIKKISSVLSLAAVLLPLQTINAVSWNESTQTLYISPSEVLNYTNYGNKIGSFSVGGHSFKVSSQQLNVTSTESVPLVFSDASIRQASLNNNGGAFEVEKLS